MRLRPLLLVILCVWTTLLLLASSCQAVRTRFDLSGHKRPASYFLEPTSSDGREKFKYDAQGSNKRAKNVSIRPSYMRQRGSSDPEADVDYAFLKKGDRNRGFDDAEKVSAGKVARKASSSHGDRLKGAGDIHQVTVAWAHFKMVLANGEREHYRFRDDLWNDSEQINEYVDEMLGPPSTMNGDDLSRLNLYKVPPVEVKKELKKLEDAFKARIVCGWATSHATLIKGHWQISVDRYVPKGGWRNPYKTFTEREKTMPEFSSSSLAASAINWPKEVNFNFDLLGWPSDEKVLPRRELVQEQWFSRPEGFTDLIFFNVPLARAERVRKFLTKQYWDGKAPQIKVLFGGEMDKCRVRLRGKDEARFAYY